jgi:putative ABC transport system substrate-binding protein
MIRRREFIILLGGAAAAWPRSARAQQPLRPTIGVLGSTSARVQANFLRVLHQGLGEAATLRVATPRLNIAGQTR